MSFVGVGSNDEIGRPGKSVQSVAWDARPISWFRSTTEMQCHVSEAVGGACEGCILCAFENLGDIRFSER